MRVDENNYKLLRLYIRNLSVESPLTGRLPSQINQPNIDVDIDPTITRVADNLYEVAARFTVSARGNGAQLYLIELTQAGFFSIAPSGEAHSESLLRRVFPQLIYPAARNNIVSFIVAAGYQPIVLDHIRLEDLFTRTEIVDWRPSSSEPLPQGEKLAATARNAVQTVTGKRGWLRPVALGAAVASVLMLMSQMDWQGYWARFGGKSFGGKTTALQAERPIAMPQIAASQPRVMSVPVVVQNTVSGSSVAMLEKMGSDWLLQQEKGAYTIELLRTDDLKNVENIAPIDEGLPMFLVKLPGKGKAEYAVLSGTYGSEEQVRQAAAKSAGYRPMRFGDYR